MRIGISSVIRETNQALFLDCDTTGPYFWSASVVWVEARNADFHCAVNSDSSIPKIQLRIAYQMLSIGQAKINQVMLSVLILNHMENCRAFKFGAQMLQLLMFRRLKKAIWLIAIFGPSLELTALANETARMVPLWEVTTVIKNRTNVSRSYSWPKDNSGSHSIWR